MILNFIWNCLCFVLAFYLINCVRVILECVADHIISVPFNNRPTYTTSVLTDILGFVIWFALWVIQILSLIIAFIQIFKI